MVYIYYNKQGETELNADAFENLLQRLPLFIQHQIMQYNKWQDRQRSLIGKNLLWEGLHSFDANLYSTSNLKYTKYQRPYIDNAPDFNISHTGNYTVCAISKKAKLGIDIEKIGTDELDLFQSQFSQREIAQIKEAENSNYAFYKLWTQKEAFIKAIGIGLSLPLNSIAIENNKVIFAEKEWFLHKVNLHDEYSCYLCTSTSNPEIILKEIHF